MQTTTGLGPTLIVVLTFVFGVAVVGAIAVFLTGGPPDEDATYGKVRRRPHR